MAEFISELDHCHRRLEQLDQQRDTEPMFRERFTEVISQGRFIVLGLSGISFCDSAGLNGLLGARRLAEAREAVLALTCVPVPLRRILVMTGADQVLSVYDTLAEAACVAWT